MPVIRHTDPDAFLAAAEPMLARSEASAAFFRAFALGLKRHPPVADERVYCATYCNGEQYGAPVQRPDRGVVVEDSIANGKRRIFLVTDRGNPTSNAIYARIGFRALTDFCHFDLVSAPAAE